MMDGFMDPDVITGVEGCFGRALFFCQQCLGDAGEKENHPGKQSCFSDASPDFRPCMCSFQAILFISMYVKQTNGIAP